MLFDEFLNHRLALSAQPTINQLELLQKVSKHRVDKIPNSEHPPKQAGVLALIYPKDQESHIALMLRESYKGVHSAQVSFPGGKKEKNDIDLYQTALREAGEELSIQAQHVHLVRKLNKVYIPPSNFMVSPFLSYSNKRPDFKSNYEVAELIELPLKVILDKENIKEDYINFSDGLKVKTQYFSFKDYQIWGATAIMLLEIRAHILGL
ncbi:MAG: NUDIX hydrolase [Flavobacteriaceae bacterium]